VLQVKYIPTGNIYAMKVLNKKSIIDRGELEHTKAEQSTYEDDLPIYLGINLNRKVFLRSWIARFWFDSIGPSRQPTNCTSLWIS